MSKEICSRDFRGCWFTWMQIIKVPMDPTLKLGKHEGEMLNDPS